MRTIALLILALTAVTSAGAAHRKACRRLCAADVGRCVETCHATVTACQQACPAGRAGRKCRRACRHRCGPECRAPILAACRADADATQCRPPTTTTTTSTTTSTTLPVVKVDWPTYGFDLQRTAYNPSETVLGPANVASLTQSWSTDVGAVIAASPVLASAVAVAEGTRDLLYVGTEHGDLYALDAATGGVVWSRNLGSQQTVCDDMPGGVFGITDTPAIDRATGTLYVAGGDGQLYALDLSTGATLPGWPITITSDPAHEHVWSAITLTGGALYVETASYCDFTPFNGRVMKIDPAQPAVVDTWYVTAAPGAGFYGGGIWGWGGASVDPGGDLYVATGNAIADPETSDYGEHVVRLSTALEVVASHAPALTGGDVDFGSTPVPYQAGTCAGQIVVENKAGFLFVYDRDAITDGPAQSLAILDPIPHGELIGVPAWDPVTGMVYVSSPTDLIAGPYQHGLLAFSVGEDCMLHLAWQQTQGMNGVVVSSPTIANGVVYYGDGPGSEVLALAAATGDVLWRSADVITGGIWATPIVVNGRLYVCAWDNAVHAFAPAPAP